VEESWMRAMILKEPGSVFDRPLVVAEMIIPEPGPGEIRVRVSVCGVCHTDLHTVEGDLPLKQLPIIPGHQVVATVEKLGVGSDRFSLGDRVGIAWLHWTCGRCHYCSKGMENLCPNARFTGLDANGGYAQYMTVNEGFAYPIPDAFSDTDAAPLLCAGIVGYRALRLSGIQPGGRLGLYGFGASAHLVIQVARHWDCEVFVFTRGEDHRRLARQLGAIWTGGAEEQPPEPLDSSVIFAPAGWIVPLALKHLRPGGTIAINAIHMSDIPAMPYGRIYGERVLRSVANLTRTDAEAFLQLAAAIPIKSEVEVFSLDEANEVLIKLKNREHQGAAALRIP
jgi:propanol-preferring alcohol dehydrogenase